ncbi:hypothetical protein PHYPSEUDO_013437 [Phytophthora pseudosyringae]|uniref:FYVE-type domain-containing protein n=1 Tax=Phytophthora pseudosyringae TaxID=221518 RepID=A0A8T1WMI8_9STRA|nr:hypothetical protein PHYPSEUDO_013437 [Phytophthora pseudosyringae]
MESSFPFEAPLSLSEADRRSVQRLAQRCVDETLLDYEHVLVSKSGLPSTTRWKPVKRKSNVVVFQDRLAIEEIGHRKRKAKSLGDIIDSIRVGGLLSSSAAPRIFHSVANGETETSEHVEMPKMIWMGTVECELDDLMYGLVSQSEEVTRINASYSGNNVQEFATLASLETSTPSDPFNGLQLKWQVDSALTKAKPVWRCRDFVYLEATGFTTSSATGQRIGYQILHSLNLRSAPELPERKLVRGKMTVYQLFRQKSKGTVEVFAKAMVDLAGDLPSRMAPFATIQAANFVHKAARCARKRKLNWLLTTAGIRSVSAASDRKESCCGVCTRELRNAFGQKSFYECHICTKLVCYRCHVRQKLCFIKPAKASLAVKQKSLDLCTRCVHTATQTNAQRVALEERALMDPASMYTYVDRHTRSLAEASLEELDDSLTFDDLVTTRGAVHGWQCDAQGAILLDQTTQELHSLS